MGNLYKILSEYEKAEALFNENIDILLGLKGYEVINKLF